MASNEDKPTPEQDKPQSLQRTASAPLNHDLAIALSDLLRSADPPPEDVAGRPSKFTPDTLLRIVTAVRAGHTVADACTFAGIHGTTYNTWMRKGQNDEFPYNRFSDVMARVNVEAYHHAVTCFSQEAGKDWKAAERFLARRARKEWGTPEEQSGAGVTVIFGLELKGGPA